MMNTPLPGQQPQRILVVDDSQDMRNLLQRLLERAGYRVVLAEDGQASLTQAKLHRPDLILMDLSLPDMAECTCFLGNAAEYRPSMGLESQVSSLHPDGCSASSIWKH